MRHPNPAVIVGCIWSNHWNWVSPPLDGINGIFSSPPQWNMNRRGDIYGRGSNAVVLRHTLDRFKCGRCHLPRITCDKIPMVSEMQDDHLTMWRLLQPPLHLLTKQNKCKHLTDVNKSIPLWWNCPKLDFSPDQCHILFPIFFRLLQRTSWRFRKRSLCRPDVPKFMKSTSQCARKKGLGSSRAKASS